MEVVPRRTWTTLMTKISDRGRVATTMKSAAMVRMWVQRLGPSWKASGPTSSLPAPFILVVEVEGES